jgi:hypothetical protein
MTATEANTRAKVLHNEFLERGKSFSMAAESDIIGIDDRNRVMKPKI